MRARGFTLLEVLVALAILALALMAALRAGSVATQNEGEIRMRQLADWVALDRLEEYRARRIWLPVGSNSSEVVQGGTHFRIEEKISGTPNSQFLRIDIRVFSAESSSSSNSADSGGVLSRFTSFLVKPAG